MEIINIKAKAHFIQTPIQHSVVCCLGLFDGIHHGHMRLISKVLDIAADTSLQPAVFTLSRSVPQYFQNKNDFIYEPWQKKAIFKNLGFKFYFNYVVGPETIGVSPLTFMTKLRDELNVHKVVVGEDFRFGHKASGEVKDLIEFFGPEQVVVIPIIKHEKESKYSSKNVRKLLEQHQIQTANSILVEDIQHKSEIIMGKQIGGQIGYHTANQKIINPLLIPYGVYITKTKIKGKWQPSVSCYWKPENDILLETHIIKMDQNIYGEIITVKFVKYIRGLKPVHNLSELKTMIESDVISAQMFLNNAQE